MSTVALWVARCAGKRLDRCCFADRKPGRASNRTPAQVELRILRLRQKLRDRSILGECGPDAIQRALRVGTRAQPVPSRATITRVLQRHGALDRSRRQRRPAPPKGWYLPRVAAGQAELDSFDLIEDLKIADGPLVSVLTAKSLHGGLVGADVLVQVSAKAVVGALLARWRCDGLPAYAQFDNDTVFQGAHQFADAVGRVSRLCLALGVTPVFAPPLEHGIQNLIESFNALWQAKVWQRNRVDTPAQLQRCSARYVSAHRARSRAALGTAPARRPIPADFVLDLNAPLRGCMLFVRRTDASGHVRLLGRRFLVSRDWLNRLVRCEVDFDHHCIRCHALRRRAPADQPLIACIPYHRIDKPFQGEP